MKGDGWWEYRELLYFLTWREIKVRYKQTLLGALWALIQPVLSTLLFSLVFGKLAGIPSDGVPYPLFAYCGLLPWQIFTRALSDASTSLVVNERLITKVYFPRMLVPSAAVLATVPDFLISFAFLIVLLPFYGVVPSGALLMLPLFFFQTLLVALGAGFLLSALDVEYRDVRYTFPFLTQLWFFLSPIVYPLSMVPPGGRLALAVNPVSGSVEGFRMALLGTAGPGWFFVSISALSAVVMFAVGVAVFRRAESFVADQI